MHTDIATVAANRDDNLIALADAIVRAEEVGKLDLFIKVYNEAADKQADNTPTIEEPTMATPTIAPTRWQDQPASKSQQGYIPALAKRRGIHTVKNEKTGEMMPITAETVATMSKGFASKLYYALKAHNGAARKAKAPTMTVKSQHTAATMPDSAIEDNVALHGFDARYA